MELLQVLLGFCVILQESSSVTVTLEDGKTGLVPKKLDALMAHELRCYSTHTRIKADKSLKVDWLYYKDIIEDQNGIHIYDENSRIKERFKGKVFRAKGLNIIVKDLDYSDAGHYRCRVASQKDNPPLDSAVYHITVRKDPSTIRLMTNYPEDNRIIPGTSAKFVCQENEPKSDPPLKYRWFKNGNQLPASSSDEPQYASSKFSVDATSGILNFREVSRSDYGEYFCGGSHPKVNKYSRSTVITGPPPAGISCDMPEKFVLGGSATFTCRMTGGATNVRYKWYKDHTLIPHSASANSYFRLLDFSIDSSTGTLRFYNILEIAAGTYHCEAVTEQGTVPCWPKHSHFRPPYSSCKFPEGNVIVPGKKAQFNCHATHLAGFPNVKYTWFKDRQELPTSSADDSLYINSDFSYDTATGILSFHEVSEFDYGEYRCRVRTGGTQTYCGSTAIVGPSTTSGSIDDSSIALQSDDEPSKTAGSRSLTPCFVLEAVLVVLASVVTSLLVTVNPVASSRTFLTSNYLV